MGRISAIMTVQKKHQSDGHGSIHTNI